MHEYQIFQAMFLVFASAALLATASLFARQAMILAYILSGALIGPPGLNWLGDPELIRAMSEIGIVFLLYLLGLNLYPQKLLEMLRQATWLTLLSSTVFFCCGMVIAKLFGFGNLEAAVIGACMMFSSTILGLKLLPTTALHHRHAGEIIISVLLIQDVIAILILLALQNADAAIGPALRSILLALPGLIVLALTAERFILRPLIARFDQIQEYIFLVAIGWCLGMSSLASLMGLSHEIGAFVAGVALAASPIARFIGENLRPIRDFFLVLFFFALGAQLNWTHIQVIFVPALVLAGIMLTVKPLVFHFVLRKQAEKEGLAREMGVRLGQISEFSLLIATVALASGVISQRAGYLIQTATLLSFIASSYWIVMRLPTPISTNPDLRRD